MPEAISDAYVFYAHYERCVCIRCALSAMRMYSVRTISDAFVFYAQFHLGRAEGFKEYAHIAFER